MKLKLPMLALVAAVVCGCGPKSEPTPQKSHPSFLELASARFSVRYYDSKPVEQEKIDAILAAAFEIPENLTPSFMLDVGYPAPGVAPSPMHSAKRTIVDFVTYK